MNPEDRIKELEHKLSILNQAHVSLCNEFAVLEDENKNLKEEVERFKKVAVGRDTLIQELDAHVNKIRELEEENKSLIQYDRKVWR